MSDEQIQIQTPPQTDALQRYIELTGWIRELSAPGVGSILSADDYRSMLMRNFMRIGELSRVNTDILDNDFYPLMDAGRTITHAELSRLHRFSDALINAYNLEYVDLPLLYLQAERILRDAEKAFGAAEKPDPAPLIAALDRYVIACFAMLCSTLYLSPSNIICYDYRDRGLRAAERIIAYLAPEAFSALDDITKEIVLINARYIRALFDRSDDNGNAAVNESDLQILRRALDLADNPFYRKEAPGYNWRYHIFRTLDYFSTMTEFANARQFTKKQLLEINGHTEEMLSLYESDTAYYGTVNNKHNLDICSIRNAYLAGKMTLTQYKKQLVKLFDAYGLSDTGGPDFSAMLVPLEYLSVLNPHRIAAEDAKTLKRFYREIIPFMHKSARRGTVSSLFLYLRDILRTYIELPGGDDFETMGLNLMAAIHPPTYVHTLSVAAFSERLTEHLLERKPELFIGMPGYETLASVLAGKRAITEFVRHAALCHDFGKLMILETILTYGRSLLPSEMDLIRTHPSIGAFLLERHPGTARYAAVAKGHHKWYNNNGGYPDDFDMDASPYKTVIAIIACADCLDASTDTVGRSYKEGRSLDHYLAEVHAGSGTRYAPYLAEMLADRNVRADIEMLLAKGRDDNYRQAYHVLKKYE